MFMSKKIKLLTLGLAAALSVGIIAGCGSQNAANNDKKNFKIGIVQLVEHNALDAANKGFVDGLKQRGYEEGKNITIDRQNAQADQSNLQNIGQRFVNDKVDLICAIATPAAQTVANLTKDIPIVGTAITDYEGAKLVASNSAPKGNVTGTSDMNPVKEQIDLLMPDYGNAALAKAWLRLNKRYNFVHKTTGTFVDGIRIGFLGHNADPHCASRCSRLQLRLDGVHHDLH